MRSAHELCEQHRVDSNSVDSLHCIHACLTLQLQNFTTNWINPITAPVQHLRVYSATYSSEYTLHCMLSKL